jgi:uncharacterized beta-barrel protein YwiB (DUF1934 family)
MNMIELFSLSLKFEIILKKKKKKKTEFPRSGQIYIKKNKEYIFYFMK